MPILSSDIRDKVSYYSGASLDKIVSVHEGSFDTAAATTVGGYLKRHGISHSFTRPLFTKLVWSTDNTTWVDGGLGYRSSDSSRLPSISYSTSSEIRILTGITSGTLYYKIIGFWIDGYDGSNPSVPQFTSGDTVQFDSRENYQKIYLPGQYTSSLGSPSTTTISHNLTYRPNIRAYCETLSGEIWPALYGGALNFFNYDPANFGELATEVTTSDLILKWYGPAGRKIFYNIYYD